MDLASILKPADIVLSTSATSWQSKIIRWFEKKQTGSARVSHASLSLVGISQVPELIESQWLVERVKTEEYNEKPIVVWRHRNLTDLQRSSITLRSVSLSNHPYGMLKLPLFGLDALFNTYWFTQHANITNFKVCSQLIAWTYYKELLEDSVFGIEWRSVSPDAIDDYCRNHPEEWESVYCSISESK